MRPGREHRRLPEAPAEGRGHRGRLLFGYFLLGGSQEKVTALPGAHPGSSCSCSRSGFYAHHWLIHVRRWGYPPHTRTYFSCLAKKSKQQKATPVPLSLRWRSGQPAVLAPWAALRNSHRSLRSLRSNKRNESDVEARGSPRSPRHCAPRQGHRGKSYSGYRCARPSARAFASLGRCWVSGTAPSQKSTCSPTSSSRPGIEVPQPPFWKAGFAVQGVRSSAMKTGWRFRSNRLFTPANSFTPGETR